MVDVGGKLNTLKQGPKEDKVAVASGIAVSVVIVLLVAWAIFFFRSIQQGTQKVNLSGGAQDQFNFTSVKQAQQQLQQDFGAAADASELTQIRNASAAGQTGGKLQTDTQQIQGVGSDQFGSQGSTY